MIQVRYNIFETNSSSTMTFTVDICQVEELDIPPVVKIESNGNCWERNLNGIYAWAVNESDEEAFFGLLAHVGVKEIYVDGKHIQANKYNYRIKFTKEPIALACCFGDFKSFSEWHGYGDEWDSSQYLTKEQVKLVQTLIKDPRYIIICSDEDGNEIDWESTRFAMMIVTDEEIEAEREYLAHKAEYDKDLDEDYPEYDDRSIEDSQEEDAMWEDDDFYLTKKNRHNKKKNRKR
jgi:hypothetical protein